MKSTCITFPHHQHPQKAFVMFLMQMQRCGAVVWTLSLLRPYPPGSPQPFSPSLKLHQRSMLSQSIHSEQARLTGNCCGWISCIGKTAEKCATVPYRKPLERLAAVLIHSASIFQYLAVAVYHPVFSNSIMEISVLLLCSRRGRSARKLIRIKGKIQREERNYISHSKHLVNSNNIYTTVIMPGRGKTMNIYSQPETEQPCILK